MSRQRVGFVETVLKIAHAGVSGSPMPNRVANDWNAIPDLSDRIDHILGVLDRPNRPANNMLFFVMYDITSDKVRTQVVKYLERKGCIRVQRSIFLADLESAVYEQIRSDLTKVQAAYENNDSILIVPISTDYLNSMKVIGQAIELDVILHNKNTLFF